MGAVLGKGDAIGIERARFRAFVSYSHADAAIAKKLHQKIETYKLPKLLRAMQPEGERDGRLGRLFRDREDLPAALDLSESVKAALSQSLALIVLCSPNAKSSPWVAKEIDLFRQLHPDRPILAALVKGEPKDAFPEALLRAGEPLAADLRKEGDGWRLGMLKLIAGVAEIPLDALIRRDTQRHIRSVMTVTLATTLGLIFMIGMTVFAIQQRNEAQHQQAQAERLIEYMLTDLRTKLKSVGRLDVMTDVNEQAMDYYEYQSDLSDMSIDSLERRARILHAMGEDDEKRSNLAMASEKFDQAYRMTEVLLARDPGNPKRIFGHAQSEYWVGYIAYLKKDWRETEERWRNYEALASRLLKIDNRKKEWLREAGYAQGNLCTLSIESNRPATVSIRKCYDALKRMKSVLELGQADQKSLMDVANRYGWMALAVEADLDYSLGLKYRRDHEKIVDDLLANDPKNAELKDTWLTAQMSMAQSEVRLTQRTAAESRLLAAAKIARELTQLDGNNNLWKTRLTQIETQIAEISKQGPNK